MPYVRKKEYYDLLDTRARLSAMQEDLDHRNEDITRLSKTVQKLIAEVASLKAERDRLREAVSLCDDFFAGYIRGGGGPTIRDCRKAIRAALKK
jgi:hypothetical protein